MYGMLNQGAKDIKNKVDDIKIFHSQPLDYVKINLASPSLIRSWGERKCPNGKVIGEVTNPSTVNYKTFKPIMGGIFCEQVFGPVTAFVCACGYSDSLEEETICPTCLVKKTSTQMRRTQMGIIDLLVPVAHVWYVKGRVNKIAHILGENSKELESNIYFEATDGSSMQGSAPILKRLKEINLENDAANIRIELSEKDEKGKFIARGKERRTLMKQLKVINQFRGSGSKPAWMILEVIPILPPELRPFLELQTGGFIFSDINELYRSLLMRTRRYKMFKTLWNRKDYNIPTPIQQSGARLIQESVDALIQNGKRGRPVVAKQTKVPLKSLTDIIQGKEGRLRRNLLGKRVDYSGRSVVVSGHNLNSGECGLPFMMGLELFRPFILHFLINCLRWDPPLDVRQARVLLDGALGSRMFKNKDFSKPDDLFEKLILKGSTIDFPAIVSNLAPKHMVLLNRAPTLHRYGFQAFTPVIVPGKALQLPLPLCVGFNADFDGDQMGVHLPLSLEAQLEAAWIMSGAENLVSCSYSNDYMQSVTQEAVLGIFCASMDLSNRPIHVFSKPADVSRAMGSGYVNHFTPILLKDPIYSPSGSTYKYIRTTVGRVLCYRGLLG